MEVNGNSQIVRTVYHFPEGTEKNHEPLLLAQPLFGQRQNQNTI